MLFVALWLKKKVEIVDQKGTDPLIQKLNMHCTFLCSRFELDIIKVSLCRVTITAEILTRDVFLF